MCCGAAGVACNPLKSRMLRCFDVDQNSESVSFQVVALTLHYCRVGAYLVCVQEFVCGIAVFSEHGPREHKMKGGPAPTCISPCHTVVAAVAFQMHDFDEDGKISHDDLLQYLKTVSDFGAELDDDVEDKLAGVVERTMNEASSDPKKMFLTYDDFVKVRNMASRPQMHMHNTR